MPRQKTSGIRPTIGFQLSNFHERYGYQLWPGVFDVTQEKDSNLLVFPGEALYSPYGYEYQHNLIYDFINAHNVDALVMASGTLCNYLSKKEVENFYSRFSFLPMVSIGIKIEGIPSVIVDNKSGMKEAVTHLIQQHRFRKIAFIRGPVNNQEAEERFLAYTEALTEHGIPVDQNLIATGNFAPSSGMEAIRFLLDKKKCDIEAVVVANDDMALGVLDELNSRGISVPRDIAVVGFDDIEEIQYHTTPLTTVRQPLYEQAKKATEIAIDMIEGKEVPDTVILPTKLVVRTSCGCFSPTIMLFDSDGHQKASPDKEKEKILAKVATSISTYAVDSKRISGWVEHLVELLGEKEMNEKTSTDFLQKLNEALSEEIKKEGDISVWQNIITIIRNFSISGLTADSLRRAEDLFQKSRLLIAEKMELEQALRRMRIERSFDYLMVSVIQKLISTLYVEELMDTIAGELPNLRIKSCYVCLFQAELQRKKDDHEWELPEWSELAMAYDESGKLQIGSDRRYFYSKNMLPDGILPSKRRYSMVVKPLFFREDQLGFIIFELNQKKEVNTFETLRLQISSALKGSLLFRDRKKAEEKLFEALKNLEESNIKLQNLSQKDELTGLYNRRGFLTMATQNINLAARMRKNGLLFYADLDGLKRINDTYGHTEGDIAIIKTAKILKKTFRDADILARLGGDEYVILAIDTPAGFMENLRKRLDKNLESYNNSSGKLYKISISMGAAPFNHSDVKTIEELMVEADHVLYDQKKERKAKQK